MKLSPPLFCGAKLSLVNLNLLVYEALGVFHLLAIAACRVFGKDGQQRLHDVFRALRGPISIGDRHQVCRLRRDRHIPRQLPQQILLVALASVCSGSEVNVAQMYDLLQVGPTEQGSLQEFDLTQRVVVDRDPFQQWRQELIGVDVNPRR